jgi:hypothetical protein
MLLTSGGGGHAPLFYFVSANKAFFLGGSDGVEAGVLEPQTSTAAPSGIYSFGTIAPDSNNGQNDGVATFSGSPLAISVISDNNGGGNLSAGQTFGPLGVSVDSNGLGSIGTSGCTIGATGSSGCQLIFYVISPTRAVLLELLNDSLQVPNNPSLQIADQ